LEDHALKAMDSRGIFMRRAVRSVYETYCAGEMDIIEAIKEQ